MSQAYRSHEERSTARRKWMNVPPGMTPDLADEFMRRLNAGGEASKDHVGRQAMRPRIGYPSAIQEALRTAPRVG